MGILAWIVFGLVAGYLAKILMPGKDPGGVIVTVLIGIGGAVLGGFLGTLLGFGEVTDFNIRSMALAVGGALLLLIGFRVLQRG